MEASYHSIVRANERTRYSGDTAVRFIENGLQRGKAADEFSQDENRYLKRASNRGCTALAYNGFCLIVNGEGKCVTLFPLPAWFGKKRFYERKVLICNARKYCAGYMSEAAY